MTTPAFIRNYAQVIQSIQHSLENDRHMPAIILIYTLIDSFSWAYAENKSEDVRPRFERWFNNFVLSQNTLPCTATELYAARCGVLHTLTSTAKLTSNGKIRQIAYSWGPANPLALDKAIDLIGVSTIVGVHINTHL